MCIEFVAIFYFCMLRVDARNGYPTADGSEISDVREMAAVQTPRREFFCAWKVEMERRAA